MQKLTKKVMVFTFFDPEILSKKFINKYRNMCASCFFYVCIRLLMIGKM